MKTTASF